MLPFLVLKPSIFGALIFPGGSHHLLSASLCKVPDWLAAMRSQIPDRGISWAGTNDSINLSESTFQIGNSYFNLKPTLIYLG